MAEKGIGSKIRGLFIETEDEAEGAKPEAGKSAADLVAELAKGAGVPPKAAGPSAAETAAFSKTLPGQGGQIDFDAVFKDAGLDAGELDRVRKAEELLKGLPAGIGKDVQRQIVETSLKAFGFEVAKIVSAAQLQLKALDTYVKVHESTTQKAVADAENQILQLQEKIAAVKKDVEKKRSALENTSSAAHARKTQVNQVLEFFAAPASPSKPL
jgi:cell division septum initiation protein DivIVA